MAIVLKFGILIAKACPHIQAVQTKYTGTANLVLRESTQFHAKINSNKTFNRHFCTQCVFFACFIGFSGQFGGAVASPVSNG